MPIPRFNPAKGKLILPPPGKAETGDGDTMRIDLPFRLVSVDTPEKQGVGGAPEIAQQRLAAALDALERLEADGRLPAGFAAYFAPRVGRTGAKRHYTAAEAATGALRAVRDATLARPNGRRRGLAVIPAGEVVDGNGRMLAYVAAYLEKAERDALPIDAPERRTFNMTLVMEGWAACFPIWPSFPSRRSDFDAFLDAAAAAFAERRGNWKGRNATTLLTGYEFRALIKLGRMELGGLPDGSVPTDADRLGVSRRCVARDGTLAGRFGFVGVPHGDRLWAWTAEDARALQAYLSSPG